MKDVQEKSQSQSDENTTTKNNTNTTTTRVNTNSLKSLVRPHRHQHLCLLSGMTIGIDAVYWLRSIHALKDPFADAIGGISSGIFGYVDKELENFGKWGIKPVFVFQGIVPPLPCHQLHTSPMTNQLKIAWNYLVSNQINEAQKCFALCTSRVNSDFVHFLFHHIKKRGFSCIRAPYFCGSQLAHLAQEGYFHAVFGPPGLLLYPGLEKVIINIDFQDTNSSQQQNNNIINNQQYQDQQYQQQQQLQVQDNVIFDWVDLNHILSRWKIGLETLQSACMLAGTEYCLTYPFLNLDQYPVSSNEANHLGGYKTKKTQIDKIDKTQSQTQSQSQVLMSENNDNMISNLMKNEQKQDQEKNQKIGATIAIGNELTESAEENGLNKNLSTKTVTSQSEMQLQVQEQTSKVAESEQPSDSVREKRKLVGVVTNPIKFKVQDLEEGPATANDKYNNSSFDSDSISAIGSITQVGSSVLTNQNSSITSTRNVQQAFSTKEVLFDGSSNTSQQKQQDDHATYQSDQQQINASTSETSSRNRNSSGTTTLSQSQLLQQQQQRQYQQFQQNQSIQNQQSIRNNIQARNIMSQMTSRFNFDAAISIVKAAPLIDWLTTFPTQEMKDDHVDGYCVCKVLLNHGPVYDVNARKIRPLSMTQKQLQGDSDQSLVKQAQLGLDQLPYERESEATASDAQQQKIDKKESQSESQQVKDEKGSDDNHNESDSACKTDTVTVAQAFEIVSQSNLINGIPSDYSLIMGEMLPDALITLLCTGIVSSKLLVTLSRGNWLDRSLPLVDTAEYRGLLHDLMDDRMSCERRMQRIQETQQVEQEQQIMEGTNNINSGLKQNLNQTRSINNLNSIYNINQNLLQQQGSQQTQQQLQIQSNTFNQNFKVGAGVTGNEIFSCSYRMKALGLICENLHPKYRDQGVRWRTYFQSNNKDQNSQDHTNSNNKNSTESRNSNINKENGQYVMNFLLDSDTGGDHDSKQSQQLQPSGAFVERIRHIPDMRKSCMPWIFSNTQVKREMRRQKVKKVSFIFCLKWQAHVLEQAAKRKEKEKETKISESKSDAESKSQQEKDKSQSTKDLDKSDSDSDLDSDDDEDFHYDPEKHCPHSLLGVIGQDEALLPCNPTKETLAAYVHFILIEQLELLSADINSSNQNNNNDTNELTSTDPDQTDPNPHEPDEPPGSMTVLAQTLMDSAPVFQEYILVALELLKFGVGLCGEPFDPPPEQSFPSKIRYPSSSMSMCGTGTNNTNSNSTSNQQQGPSKFDKSLFLISRAMSLVPMRLHHDLWSSTIEFDLAAFHSILRIMKRTLRQLTEACLCNVLLKGKTRVFEDDKEIARKRYEKNMKNQTNSDKYSKYTKQYLDKVSNPHNSLSCIDDNVLPLHYMCCSTEKNESALKIPAILPTFPLSRACLGIVCLFFLRFDGPQGRESLEKALVQKFGCCVRPFRDLEIGCAFWVELKRCVDCISEPLSAEELSSDMEVADKLLRSQCAKYDVRIAPPGTVGGGLYWSEDE